MHKFVHRTSSNNNNNNEQNAQNRPGMKDRTVFLTSDFPEMRFGVQDVSLGGDLGTQVRK